MRYENIKEAVFLERPNRFIAKVLVDGREEVAHVKNTGRCKELLLPGVKIYLEPSRNELRKTKWSLVSVQKKERLVNIDSQIPNKVVEEAIKSGAFTLPGITGEIIRLKPEFTHGKSRFDLYVETVQERGFIEVKGVTLEKDGVAMFPDAPTERGTRHVMELIKAVKDGFYGLIVFVIQMQGIELFKPNVATDPAFGDALKVASENGVHIVAFECSIEPDGIHMGKFIPVEVCV